jgi:hypothetical protein
MTYGVMVSVPAPVEVYQATHAEILRAVGDAPSEGLIIHFARQTSQGFQVVEVWQSKEQCDRFNRQVVMPIVERLSAGRPTPPAPPVVEEFDVLGLLTGAASLR